jgi:general secretion pathway protein E
MALAAEERSTFDKSVVDMLVDAGRLDTASLERVTRLHASSGEPLGQLLIKLGLISEHDLAAAIAKISGLPLVGERDFPDAPILEDQLSRRFLRDAAILPLAHDGETLLLAMANPQDAFAINAVRMISKSAIAPRVAVPSEIERAIERLYAQGAGTTEEDAGAADEEDDSLALDVERLKDLASEAPVIRMVNRIITRAVEIRASDIHIEPFEARLRLRYRIDGVLREVDPPPFRLRAAIASRIKIMAKLNIAERRLPQDGRIKFAARGTSIDLRVSTVPIMHGESIVMRVLDRQSVSLDFKALGIAGDNLANYLRLLEQPHGILLVTGPTGSGKTTTLYASLARLNTPDVKIITVEDPVEYQLEGVNQIQVKPSIGLDFANVLRWILRQDPNIILIGEIRDLETAQIAAQAALTGHLVLSTLHTNSAAGSVTRLIDMGLEEYLVTSTLNGVTAQRLIRTLCPHCRQPYGALPELIGQLGLSRYTEEPEIHLYRSAGCAECNGTGYKGRTTIVETLIVSDRIRQLVLRRTESRDLHRAAVEDGMTTMFDDGMRKALAGLTSYQEVLRVTREE